MNKLTQINLYEGDGYKGLGPLGLENNEAALPTFAKFISSAIGMITVIGIIWFVFTVILGALGIITSGGDKAANENARKKITSGLIGLLAIIAGVFIVELIGNLFGIPDILNVESLISRVITGGSPLNQYDSLMIVK